MADITVARAVAHLKRLSHHHGEAHRHAHAAGQAGRRNPSNGSEPVTPPQLPEVAGDGR